MSFQKRSTLFLIFLIIVLVASIIWVNQWINNEFRNDTSQNKAAQNAAAVQPAPSPKDLSGAEVIRKSKLDPSREFSESVFFAGETEIARFKNKGEDVYDYTGKIPDGKVKFEDDTQKTSGEEYYQDGKRHGPYKEYYPTGEIWREAYYYNGKLMRNKEYFIDGKLRMEADYEDVLVSTESKNIGKGKTYYRSGVLMYEWNLTNTDPNHMTKSYNIKGELVETKYFDAVGKLVKTVDPRAPPVLQPAADQSPSADPAEQPPKSP